MPDVNDIEIYEDQNINEDFERERQDEIDRAPTDPDELIERLNENHSTSPALSGGDIDAQWEEAETSGSESVFGDNPTPDQSDVEENAHAMGIDFQDNEPLDLLRKMEKRDENRYELDEDSKTDGDMI